MARPPKKSLLFLRQKRPSQIDVAAPWTTVCGGISGIGLVWMGIFGNEYLYRELFGANKVLRGYTATCRLDL